MLQLPLPPPQSQCNWLCLKHLLGFNKTEDCHSCLNWMETHPALWSVHYSTGQGHYIHFPIFLLRKNTTVKLQWGTWEAVNVFFSLVVTGNWNSTAVNAQHCESTLRFLLMGGKYKFILENTQSSCYLRDACGLSLTFITAKIKKWLIIAPSLYADDSEV